MMGVQTFDNKPLDASESSWGDDELEHLSSRELLNGLPGLPAAFWLEWLSFRWLKALRLYP